MYKRRRLNRPNVPQDAEEAIALLNDCCGEYRIYSLFSINEPANRELQLVSWIHTIRFRDSSTSRCDFYVVPKQFYQLLNIFLHYKSYTQPAIHILMSCKSRALYDKIVMKIKTILQLYV